MSENAVLHEVVELERTFDAPIDLVWDMWTKGEHFKNWYGPKGLKIPVAEMDVRVGGKRLVCMEIPTPNGPMNSWLTGEYREVTPKTRLVYTDTIADEQGNAMTMQQAGVSTDDYPEVTEVTVELVDLGGRTKVTLKHAGLPDGDAGTNGAKYGWSQSFTKMAEYMPTVAA